jgi:hypothetical protein
MRCHSIGCGMPGPNAVANAIGYAEYRSRSHHAVIRVYDESGNVTRAISKNRDSTSASAAAKIQLKLPWQIIERSATLMAETKGRGIEQ